MVLQRPLVLEALAYGSQHLHLPLGPFDPAHTLGGLTKVFDVMTYTH